jgi:hypothetical protein
MNKLKITFALLACVALARKLNALLHRLHKPAGPGRLAHQALAAGSAKLPDEVMTEIGWRATHVGPILQRILNDSAS